MQGYKRVRLSNGAVICIAKPVCLSTSTCLSDILLPQDILRIIVERAWNKTTHQSLVSTCSVFNKWLLGPEGFITRRYVTPRTTVVNGVARSVWKRIPCLSVLLRVMPLLHPTVAAGHCRNSVQRMKLHQQATPPIIDAPPLTKEQILYYSYLRCGHADIVELIKGDYWYKRFMERLAEMRSSLYDPHPAWRLLATEPVAWDSQYVWPDVVCPIEYQNGVIATLNKNTELSLVFIRKLCTVWEALQGCRVHVCATLVRIVSRYYYSSRADSNSEELANGIKDMMDKIPIPLLAILCTQQVLIYHQYSAVSNALLAKLIYSNDIPCEEAITWLNRWSVSQGAARTEDDYAVRFIQAVGLQKARLMGVILPYSMVPNASKTIKDLLALVANPPNGVYSGRNIGQRLEIIQTHPLWQGRTSEDVGVLLDELVLEKWTNQSRIYELIDSVLRSKPATRPIHLRERLHLISEETMVYFYMRWPSYCDLTTVDMLTLLRGEFKVYRNWGVRKHRIIITLPSLVKIINTELSVRGSCAGLGAIAMELVNLCTKWITRCGGTKNDHVSHIYFELLMRLIPLPEVILPPDYTLKCDHCLKSLLEKYHARQV